jgi:16S rRNA processing protein RimM
MGNELYLIGTITKSLGIKGEVRVSPFTDFIKRFYDLNDVFVGGNSECVERFRIERVKIKGKNVTLKFFGIDSITGAEALVHQGIYITEDKVVKLPKDTYYIHDIIGVSVFSEDGQQLGEIVDVMALPANDVYVLRTGEGEVLIPAIKPVVKEVNVQQRKMVIHVMEGLLE